MKTMKLAVLASVAIALAACQNSDPDDINEPTGAEEGTTATWQLVNDDVTAESASLEIGVMRIECAGGETGQVLTPNINYNDDQIIIEALVETLPDGAYTCPSNDVIPIEVQLDEPVGDRKIVDGICLSGGGGDCTADGVRWPAP